MNDKELSRRAKDYLSQIHKIDRVIQRLTDTMNTLRSSLTSQNYELKPDKVQTSGPKDSLGEIMVKIISLEDDINGRIDELVAMKKDAFSKIRKIPDLDQQNILIARYIQNKKWETIADETEHEVRWVYRNHGKALLAFASVMDSIKQ